MAALAVHWPAAVLDVRMLPTCQWHEMFYNLKKKSLVRVEHNGNVCMQYNFWQVWSFI